MLNIFRYIPHPSYGNYGGRNNKCDKGECPLPIDWMDAAFRDHDHNLKYVPTMADNILAGDLRYGDPQELIGIYAMLYLIVSKIIFRPKRRKNHA